MLALEPLSSDGKQSGDYHGGFVPSSSSARSRRRPPRVRRARRQRVRLGLGAAQGPLARWLPPAAIRSGRHRAGRLRRELPAMEYFDTDNKTVSGSTRPQGAQRGPRREFEFQNTNFHGIIGGLNAGRYDLEPDHIMIDKKAARPRSTPSSTISTPASPSTMLKGNPKDLTDKVDLCGKTAAVEKGSTGDLVGRRHHQGSARRTARRPWTRSRSPSQASAVRRHCSRAARTR